MNPLPCSDQKKLTEIPVVPGDCGSWVIDPVTGDIYGIIIATAPEAQESYMIPAYQVYSSIQSRLPRGTAAEFAEIQKKKQALSQDAADIVSEASDMVGAGRGTHGIKRRHSEESDCQEPVLASVTERGECSIPNSLQFPIGPGSARPIPSSVAQLLDQDSAVFDDDHVAANTLRQLLREAQGEVRLSDRMEDSMEDTKKTLLDLLSAVFDDDVAASALRQLLRDARGEVHPSERMEHSMEDVNKPVWDLLRSPATSDTQLRSIGDEENKAIGGGPEVSFFDLASPSQGENEPIVTGDMDRLFAQKRLFANGEKPIHQISTSVEPEPPTSSFEPGERHISASTVTVMDSSTSTICRSCRTTTTPLWRRGDDGALLCNDCGMRETRLIEDTSLTTTLKPTKSSAHIMSQENTDQARSRIGASPRTISTLDHNRSSSASDAMSLTAHCGSMGTLGLIRNS